MNLSLICPILDVFFAGLTIYAMNKLVAEHARLVAANKTLIEANKTIDALNNTIESLKARVQDERSGVAELFLNQSLVIDELVPGGR